MKFLVMQIGCIECGVSTFPIKVTDSYEEAVKIAKAHPNTWDTEGGDGYVMVVDIDNCKDVAWRQ